MMFRISPPKNARLSAAQSDFGPPQFAPRGRVGEPTEAVESTYVRGADFVDGALVGIVDLDAALDTLIEERAT